MTPPTRSRDCPAGTEEPAAKYRVIASCKAAWQSVLFPIPSESGDAKHRRSYGLPRPYGLAMTARDGDRCKGMENAPGGSGGMAALELLQRSCHFYVLKIQTYIEITVITAKYYNRIVLMYCKRAI